MKLSPINTVNNNNVFTARIQPTQSLKEGFDMVERSANSVIMKDMNYAKDFVDSIARINESTKVSDFKIEIDKRRQEHTYTKINGRRVSGGHNERIPNIQDAYLVVEGIKRYASNLEELEPSVLDALKKQVEEAQNRLDELKARYSARLKAEFENAKKFIFEDAK